MNSWEPQQGARSGQQTGCSLPQPPGKTTAFGTSWVSAEAPREERILSLRLQSVWKSLLHPLDCVGDSCSYFYDTCLFVSFSGLSAFFPSAFHAGLSSVRPYSRPGSSAHEDSPGKNTGVGSHSLLQQIFPPRDQIQVSHIAGGFFTLWTTREAQCTRNPWSSELAWTFSPPKSPGMLGSTSKRSWNLAPLQYSPCFVLSWSLLSLSSVQSLSCSQLFEIPWTTAACQASLSITNSRSLLKLMSTHGCFILMYDKIHYK